MRPAWLPAFCTTDGEWNTVVHDLYEVFRRDFVLNPPRLQGRPVWWNRRMHEGYEEAFWHLIEKEDAERDERCFDPRRAERLCWCCATIQHWNNPAVKSWRYREGRGQLRLYLWIEEEDYVVILEERGGRSGTVYFLITAHHLDGENRRRNLQRKYGGRER